MSSGRANWLRVSKARPCPVCGRRDWCLVSADNPANPSAAICARIESDKRTGEAGWLHRLRQSENWRADRRTVRIVQARLQSADFGKLAARYAEAVGARPLGDLARSLGVSAESLARLGIGWAAEHRAWAFPMRDASGNVLGIRLRLADSRKLAVKGGREGLFLPEALSVESRELSDAKRNSKPSDPSAISLSTLNAQPSTLVICEGPTDTASLLDLGFGAIGRPSCSGGVRLLTELLRRRQPGEVVIVADADSPGQRGAANLAGVLTAYAASVRIITPPRGIKDARAWLQAGATHADVLAAIAATPARRLSVRTGRALRVER